VDIIHLKLADQKLGEDAGGDRHSPSARQRSAGRRTSTLSRRTNNLPRSFRHGLTKAAQPCLCVLSGHAIEDSGQVEHGIRERTGTTTTRPPVRGKACWYRFRIPPTGDSKASG
jgi:hypothetical protein